MTATAGYLAIVQIGNTPVTVTGIKTCDLTIGQDIYDITAFSDGVWHKKLAGLADWSLKLAGNHDLSDAQQAALQAAVLTTPGSAVTVAIYPQGTGAGNPKYSGSCLLKTIAPKFSVSAENQVSFDLEGNGALTYA